MIKALFAFAVSIIAIFWVAGSAYAAGHPSFETNRRTIAGGLCIFGIILCLIGLAAMKRKKAGEPSENEPAPEADPDADPGAPGSSSRLTPFSPHYWGLIFGLMGVAVLFIRPLYINATIATVAPKPAVAAAQKLPPDARVLPRFAKALALPKLKLQGVIFRETNPSAIINGKTFYPGDRIEGAEVVAISRGSVSLSFDGSTNVIWLRQ